MEISVRLPVIYSPSLQFHSVLRRWASPTELVEGTDMYLYTTRAVALSTQVLAHTLRHVRMRRIVQTRWKLPCDER